MAWTVTTAGKVALAETGSLEAPGTLRLGASLLVTCPIAAVGE